MSERNQARRVPDAWSSFALLLGAAVLIAVVVIALLGYGREALLLLVLFAVIGVAGGLALLASRRALDRHDGDVVAADRDAEPSAPTLLLDEEQPIGAASESEVSPQDTPGKTKS
jgi:hypothetical protein